MVALGAQGFDQEVGARGFGVGDLGIGDARRREEPYDPGREVEAGRDVAGLPDRHVPTGTFRIWHAPSPLLGACRGTVLPESSGGLPGWHPARSNGSKANTTGGVRIAQSPRLVVARKNATPAPEGAIGSFLARSSQGFEWPDVT